MDSPLVTLIVLYCMIPYWQKTLGANDKHRLVICWSCRAMLQLSTTKDLYIHDFTADIWHNFDVDLDFNEKYSPPSH
jgi:hypothetical protein